MAFSYEVVKARSMSERSDEEDKLPVPAGFIRVVSGIVLMLSGFLTAALSDNEWVQVVGLLLFLLSPLVMLRWPNEEYK